MLLHDPINQCLLTADKAPVAHFSIFAKKEGEAEGLEPSRSSRGKLVGSVCNPNLNLLLAVDEHSNVTTWGLAHGNAAFQFNARVDGGEREGRRAGEGHEAEGGRTTAVAFDESGRRLLTGTADGRVRIFNFSTGSCLFECLPPTARRGKGGRTSTEITSVMGIRHANTPFIVGTGWAREVWFWPDQAVGSSHVIACCRVLCGHVEDVLCASFAPPNLLAAGAFDGTVLVWNLDSGAIKGRLTHEGLVSVEHLAFLSFSRSHTAPPLLLSAGGDGRLRCWCAVTLRLFFAFPLTPPPGACSGTHPITSLVWDQPTTTLLVGDAAGRLALWGCSRLEGVLHPREGGGSRPVPLLAKGPARAEDVYHAFEPLARWRAHKAAVVGASVLRAAELLGEAGREAGEAGGGGVASGGGGLGVEGGEGGGRGGGRLDLLVVSAATDCGMRLWSARGEHVGSFGRDRWELREPQSFAPPPRLTLGEGRGVWEAPPLFESLEEGRVEATPDLSSLFLTSLDDRESGGQSAREEWEAPACSLHQERGGLALSAAEEALPPHSIEEREQLLEARAKEGVVRALGSASTHTSHARLPSLVRCNSMLHSASAPMLPPLDDSFGLGADGGEEREEGRRRAQTRASAKEGEEEGDDEVQSASDTFLQAREKAMRSDKPQPRRLEVYALTPLQRREPLRERLGRLKSRNLFVDR